MRSMVEGWLHPGQRIERETAKACALYPSTTLRVVPLPIWRWGGKSYRHLACVLAAGSLDLIQSRIVVP
jgi:hypothetical protein